MYINPTNTDYASLKTTLQKHWFRQIRLVSCRFLGAALERRPRSGQTAKNQFCETNVPSKLLKSDLEILFLT